MWTLLLLLTADTTSASFTIALAPAESLRVTTAGAGPPVVLLPGLFGSAYAYRHVVPTLATSGYRTIVVEPLGVGGSARPARADYSLTAQADRVARALDALDVRDAIVVAHAIGASIALRLAYRRPELVSGIVSLEGGAAESATTPGFRRALTLVPWIKLFGGAGRIRTAIRNQLTAGSGDTSWVTDDVIDGYTAGATRDLDATLRADLAMGKAREPEPLAPRLGAIHCPVRLLVGGAWHRGGPGAAEVDLLTRQLSRFAVDTVPGAGHFPHEERPMVVLDAIRALGKETS